MLCPASGGAGFIRPVFYNCGLSLAINTNSRVPLRVKDILPNWKSIWTSVIGDPLREAILKIVTILDRLVNTL